MTTPVRYLINKDYAISSNKNDSCPFGLQYEKYWERRYDLFSKFDEGVKVDEEGLYSVKPEVVAREIAKIIPGSTVIDAMCGLGGVSIALAQSGKQVIAIDKNRSRLDLARNNARVYGVEKNISFVEADAIQIIPTMRTEAVFLDPSWGGPHYAMKSEFNLSDFIPNGNDLLIASLAASNNVFLCGPRQLVIDSSSKLWTVIKIMKHLMWERIICVTARIQRQ